MTTTKQKSALRDFRSLLDSKDIITDSEQMAPFLTEWRDKYQGSAAAVLQPRSVDELSAIVKIANKQEIGLVPQGGNTGLVGAQIAFDGTRQFVVSLSRLNKILNVDPVGYTITVEAGTVLQHVQDAADEVDRLFPLSLGSEGSCQIGGNLSSNAGGTGALAYGTARDMVLDIEAVLPNGDVYRGLNRLKKDNTGYDLKNLFIGAEGTLGFITAASLKLFPKPKGRQAAILGFSDLDKIARFYNRAQAYVGPQLTTFEIMQDIGMEFLLRHIDGVRNPLSKIWPWFALIEVCSGQSAEHADGLLMDLLEEGLAAEELNDGTVASSEAQRLAFWHLRHELSGVQKCEGGSIKHDTSTPVSVLPDFIREAQDLVKKLIPGCRPVIFGHWGDGNIHFNVSQPIDMNKTLFLDKWDLVNDHVHDLVMTYDGSISAEHGIGVMKREKLAKVKDSVALNLMRQIKNTLDPNGIMNPGKVL